MEASALARKVADAGLPAVMSFAGRVDSLKPQPLPMRVGGFGGVDGLADYLRSNAVTRVIDATHPFAAQISRNAVEACRLAGVPLVALTRAPWIAQAGDSWTHVDSIEQAAKTMDGEPRRVFLAIGRMHLSAFLGAPQHFYLMRLVDEPAKPLAFPNAKIVIARGPFAFGDDLALLRTHGIDLVVSKNSGGDGARSKIDAARALGIDVLMIDRPELPNRQEMHDVNAIMAWIAHPTDLGV